MKNLLLITCMLITFQLQSQKIDGEWNGALEIQGMQLRIVFYIEKIGDGYSATLDSPDQGAKGIPTDKTTFQNGELEIIAAKLGMNYKGQMSEDGLAIEGKFNQNGMSFPLKLTGKKIAKKAIIRPQNPTDFPYQQELVKFQNPKGGHHLAGTLTMPSDGNFNQVVILISGSGPQDRNEELLGHQPFLVLSDHLTRHGIAVLRYDDRGVAESEGDFSSATSADFAEDVEAAVAFLKSRKEMQGKQIGLVGHSEGGLIAPMVASQKGMVDFIVLLAGPGIPIKELMLLQTRKIAEAGGADDDFLNWNTAISEEAFSFMIENKTMEKEELENGLIQIFDQGFDQASEATKKELGDKSAFIDSQVKALLSNWFIYFMRHDPADFLTKVQCPVLAINGELDLQVTPKENLEGIRKSLEKAGNKNFTVKEFKSQNHLFQKAATGAPSEYGKIEETFNEETLKFVSDWILKNGG